MKRITYLVALLGLALAGSAAFAAASTPAAANDFWQTPTIAGAGKIHALPQSAYQPDPKLTYKVVFSLSSPGAKPDQVSPSLDHVARAVNLYVSAGVPLDHLKFVAIASGRATPIVLNNAQYQKKFGVDNPNLALIEQLRKAGVDVAVCGQAVAENGFEYDWVDSRVTLALSALTTITELQQQGYALLPL